MDFENMILQRRKNGRQMVLLCALGLLMNFLGVRLATGLHIPLFLDNIGSALVAAIGGYIPGIIVGSLTNLINGIADTETTYYGFLNILIAVCSAGFAAKKFYSRPSRWPAVILTFSLIGGGIGSVLTWLLYGFNFGAGISAPLACYLFSLGKMSRFWSQFSADMLIDLADKTITVCIVGALLMFLPKDLLQTLHFRWWRQTPLTEETKQALDENKTGKRSLRGKIICVVAFSTLIMSVVVTLISFIHYRNASIQEQLEMAQGVVKVMEDSFDADRVDEYIEKGWEAEGYAHTMETFRKLMDVSDKIEFCYVYRILEDGCHVVFDPDTDTVKGGEPGEIVEFDQAFSDYLPDLLAGKAIEPVTSDETYGWLLTIYDPVYDSSGKCQCYAAVDINMNHIAISGFQFLTRVVSLFLCFFVIILTVTIWLAEYNVIMPINSMAMLTGELAFNDQETCAASLRKLEKLDISTNDEIENLYKAIVKTTEAMVAYTDQMKEQGEQIGRLQNGLVMVLADMVESRDQNTGDHVRKTAAYVDIITRQLKKEGYYADQITEEFARDVVNSAPLHDVGKIQVPDAVLNKPGKLTDEEFDLMKTHTTAGSEVIASAMDMVSDADSSYLQEARNLAHYHHEKWNGKGYPCGLAGEDIPLSARIMAVADVFDALVSKRSYKEGMPFEKAMDIIKKDSGTHFDPLVAKAFIDASDEVREVMESHMDKYEGSRISAAWLGRGAAAAQVPAEEEQKKDTQPEPEPDKPEEGAGTKAGNGTQAGPEAAGTEDSSIAQAGLEDAGAEAGK